MSTNNKLITLEQFGMLAAKVKAEDDVLGTKIAEIVEDIEGIVATGGEANVLEGVKVNGQVLQITDKMVDILIAAGDEEGTISVNGAAIAIPGLAKLLDGIDEDELGEALKASIAAKATNADLQALTVRVGNIENAGYQNAEQVQTAIAEAIAASGHAHFEEVDAVPSAENAEENVMYLVMNEETSHYDIYAKVGENVVLLDDTTVDLSNYYTKGDVDAAISTAISGLNIDQYATDEELNAAIGRISTLENSLSNYYTKSEVDAELAKKMNVADMGTYSTDEEATAKADAALESAKTYADEQIAANTASTDEAQAELNKVWTENV